MNLFTNFRNSSINVLIYFVLIFIVVNGILDYFHKSVLRQHETTTEQVKSARHYSNEVLRDLNLVDLGFRGFYIIQKEDLLSPYNQGINNFPNNVRRLDSVLVLQGIDFRNFQPVKQAYHNYFALLEQMIEWRKLGNTAAIDSVVSMDPGFVVWEAYKKFNDELEVQEKDIFQQSLAKTERVGFISTVIRISLLLFGFPTLTIVLIRLNRERVRRKKLFQELDKNNKEYLFDPKEEEGNELDEQKVINTLIQNLRQATEFISKITSGNFDIKWNGLTDKNKSANQENLVGELWKMRDQMIKVKEEDYIRLWVTEGISKFSEIVRRNHHDLSGLSDLLASNVVKYMGANQASLFFAVEKDNQTVLELYGCYAYDRKKYLEKVVEPGQGLVGQTYLEKEYTILTKVPQNYVRITSGLGEATPTCLLILPLKSNDKVEGILEIASFHAFKPHQIEMLEKIGEIIASAVLGMRASEQMKQMMESMQYQSEEMKAQEEEMRQNMEELQATQEEMSRKAREYQDLLHEKEQELENKRRYIDELMQQLEQKS